MAKKLTSAKGYHCRDCSHAYDYHEVDYKGDFFLCKCPFFQFSKFLNRDYCERFKLKK